MMSSVPRSILSDRPVASHNARRDPTDTDCHESPIIPALTAAANPQALAGIAHAAASFDVMGLTGQLDGADALQRVIMMNHTDAHSMAEYIKILEQGGGERTIEDLVAQKRSATQTYLHAETLGDVGEKMLILGPKLMQFAAAGKAAANYGLSVVASELKAGDAAAAERIKAEEDRREQLRLSAAAADNARRNLLDIQAQYEGKLIKERQEYEKLERRLEETKAAKTALKVKGRVDKKVTDKQTAAQLGELREEKEEEVSKWVNIASDYSVAIAELQRKEAVLKTALNDKENKLREKEAFLQSVKDELRDTAAANVVTTDQLAASTADIELLRMANASAEQLTTNLTTNIEQYLRENDELKSLTGLTVVKNLNKFGKSLAGALGMRKLLS